MDNLGITRKTYQKNYQKYIDRTPQEVAGKFQLWIDSFINYLSPQPQVLEIGSASGRDARYMRGKGVNVLCADIMQDALTALSNEGFETAYYEFQDNPPSEWIRKFDGFFANAVLLHAPPTVLRQTLSNVAKILKPNGILAFSLKTGEGDTVTHHKMDAPRYFHFYTEETIKEILHDFPFKILSIVHSDDDKWLRIIVKLTA